MKAPRTSKIILGTVQLGLNYGINNTSGKPDRETAFHILKQAHESGIRYLDTAHAYGDSEQIIGDFNTRFSSQFEILSKFSHTQAKNIESQFSETCQNIKRDSLYCYSFHRIADLTHKQNIDYLLSLKASERIQKLGVSVYVNDEFEEVLKHDFIDIVQLPFNLLDNWSQRGELITRAKNKKIEIHVRSVFLQGLFYKDINTLPSKLAPYGNIIQNIQNTAKEQNLSIGKLALEYVLQFPQIDKILLGVDTVDQLQEIARWMTDTTSEIKFPDFNGVDDIVIDPRKWN